MAIFTGIAIKSVPHFGSLRWQIARPHRLSVDGLVLNGKMESLRELEWEVIREFTPFLLLSLFTLKMI